MRGIIVKNLKNKAENYIINIRHRVEYTNDKSFHLQVSDYKQIHFVTTIKNNVLHNNY